MPSMKKHDWSRRRRAATMVFVVITLPVLFALAALAINIAQMESVNTELQIAVDAAARAAGRTYTITGDKDQALLAAQEAAAKNPISGTILAIDAGDLDFGESQRTDSSNPYLFSPTGSGNSVRLTTRSFAAGSGAAVKPVFPFFGSAFEIRPERTAISTQGVIDICLVVDRSGSMAYSSSETAEYPPNPASAPPDWEFGDPVPPNARWLDLIAAVQTFNGELENSTQEEFLAIAMYNDSSATHRSLSNDYSGIVDQLVAVSANFTSGGTNIGGGMLEGLNAVSDASFARPHASKVIVLMTDGNHNFGTHPNTAAWQIADAGVTLYSVTFSDEAQQGLMQDVANRCGGKHYHALTATQLQNAFRDIARGLPTLLTK